MPAFDPPRKSLLSGVTSVTTTIALQSGQRYARMVSTSLSDVEKSVRKLRSLTNSNCGLLAHSSHTGVANVFGIKMPPIIATEPAAQITATEIEQPPVTWPRHPGSRRQLLPPERKSEFTAKVLKI